MSAQPDRIPSDTRGQRVEVASLLGVIERAGDLALAEEPSRFAAALEDAANETAGGTGR